MIVILDKLIITGAGVIPDKITGKVQITELTSSVYTIMLVLTEIHIINFGDIKAVVTD